MIYVNLTNCLFKSTKYMYLCINLKIYIYIYNMEKEDAWSKLTMKERANYIRAAVAEGLKDVTSIRKAYNDFYLQLDQQDNANY